jgi:hypothetical protein
LPVSAGTASPLRVVRENEVRSRAPCERMPVRRRFPGLVAEGSRSSSHACRQHSKDSASVLERRHRSRPRATRFRPALQSDPTAVADVPADAELDDLGIKYTPAIDGVPRDWLGHPGLLTSSVMLPAGRRCTRTLPPSCRNVSSRINVLHPGKNFSTLRVPRSPQSALYIE